MTDETVSSFPVLQAVVNADGTGNVTLNGAVLVSIEAEDLAEARAIVRATATDFSNDRRGGRPVRLNTTDPDGSTHELAVYSDGRIAEYAASKKGPRASAPLLAPAAARAKPKVPLPLKLAAGWVALMVVVLVVVKSQQGDDAAPNASAKRSSTASTPKKTTPKPISATDAKTGLTATLAGDKLSLSLTDTAPAATRTAVEGKNVVPGCIGEDLEPISAPSSPWPSQGSLTVALPRPVVAVWQCGIDDAEGGDIAYVKLGATPGAEVERQKAEAKKKADRKKAAARKRAAAKKKAAAKKRSAQRRAAARRRAAQRRSSGSAGTGSSSSGQAAPQQQQQAPAPAPAPVQKAPSRPAPRAPVCDFPPC